MDNQPGFQSISLDWNNSSLGVFLSEGCKPVKISADLGEANFINGWNKITFHLEGEQLDDKGPGFYLGNIQVIPHESFP